MRRRCQTDLLFLTRDVLGYTKVTAETHQEVADFFVQKNPDLPIEEQDTVKIRLLMMPRLTFKSSFNIADTVQWMLCFPNVAVMVITASNSPDSPLADAFVAEVADHFVRLPGSESKLLHLLFPEYVMAKAPSKGAFISPARTVFRRDPTVRGLSIESSLSGWHPDVIKGEDVQDNRNSQTVFSLKKVAGNLGTNLKMLPEWGYFDMTGTRYGPADVYSRYIELMEKGGRRKMLWKQAMTVKEESAHIDFDDREEDDWILNFPTLLPYQFLMDVKDEDESSFWTQYMNVAEGDVKPVFPLEKLVEATLPEETMPLSGETCIAWRMPLGEGKHAAGAVGTLDGGRLYIQEVERGIYTTSRLAKRMVGMAKRWGAARIKIEETPGARFAEAAIRNEGKRQKWPVWIQWLDFEQEDRVRDERIKSCEPHLMGARLFFSDGIAKLTAVRRQLYHYGMVQDNEVPDVVARVCELLPHSLALYEGENADDLDDELRLRQDMHDRVYNRGEYAGLPVETAPIFGDDDEPFPGNDFGLPEDMPGLNG